MKGITVRPPWSWAIAEAASLAALRPFFWPAALVGFLLGFLWRDEPVRGGAIELAVLLVAWLLLRNVDGDDRWKRRARRAAERVAQAGARLRVVPSPAAGGA